MDFAAHLGRVALRPLAAGGPDSDPEKGRLPLPRESRHSEPPPWIGWAWPLVRDVILFFGGLYGVHGEATGPDPAQWPLLIFYGAMMALPLPLRADAARRNGNDS